MWEYFYFIRVPPEHFQSCCEFIATARPSILDLISKEIFVNTESMEIFMSPSVRHKSAIRYGVVE